MTISKKEIYIYNSKQFNNFTELKLQIEAELGCIIDDIFNNKTKIQIYETIIKNRHKLINLLNEQL